MKPGFLARPRAPVKTGASTKASESATDEAARKDAEERLLLLKKMLKTAVSPGNCTQDKILTAHGVIQSLPPNNPSVAGQLLNAGGLQLAEQLMLPMYQTLRDSGVVDGPKALSALMTGLNLLGALTATGPVASSPSLMQLLPPLAELLYEDSPITFDKHPPHLLPTDVNDGDDPRCNILLKSAVMIERVLDNQPAVCKPATLRALLQGISKFLATKRAAAAAPGLLKLLWRLLDLANRASIAGNDAWCFTSLGTVPRAKVTELVVTLAAFMGNMAALGDDRRPQRASARYLSSMAVSCFEQLLRFGGTQLLSSVLRLSGQATSNHTSRDRWLPHALNGICWDLRSPPKDPPQDFRTSAMLAAARLTPLLPFSYLNRLVPFKAQESSKLQTKLVVEVVSQAAIAEFRVVMRTISATQAKDGRTKPAKQAGSSSSTAPSSAALSTPASPFSLLDRMGAAATLCNYLQQACCEPSQPDTAPGTALQEAASGLMKLAEACAEEVAPRLAALSPQQQERLAELMEHGRWQATLVETATEPWAWVCYPLAVVFEHGHKLGLRPSQGNVELLRALAGVAQGRLLPHMVAGVAGYTYQDGTERWVEAVGAPEVLLGLVQPVDAACKAITGRVAAQLAVGQAAAAAEPSRSADPHPASANDEAARDRVEAVPVTEGEPDADMEFLRRLLPLLSKVVRHVGSQEPGEGEAGNLAATLDALLNVAGSLAQWGHALQRATGLAAGEDTPVERLLPVATAAGPVVQAARVVGEVLLCTAVKQAGEGVVALWGRVPAVRLEAMCAMVAWGLQLMLVSVAVRAWERGPIKGGGSRAGVDVEGTSDANEHLDAAQMLLDVTIGNIEGLLQPDRHLAPHLEPHLLRAQWLNQLARHVCGLQPYTQEQLPKLGLVSDCALQADVDTTRLRSLVNVIMSHAAAGWLTEVD